MAKIAFILMIGLTGALGPADHSNGFEPTRQTKNEASMSETVTRAKSKVASPTIYAVTRSTQKFRIGKRDNPSVGLFTTTDRGMSWQHWGWHYTKCFSVAIEPGSDGEVLYLACGNGVQKSTDSGKNWAILTGWKMTECLKVVIDPKETQTVYSATAYGIFKSSDGGKTWRERNRGLESTFTVTVILDAQDPKTLYAATEAGVYKSTDAAETWRPLGVIGKEIRTLVQSPHDPKVLLVGTESDGIFMTQDAGKSWAEMNTGLDHKTVYALACDPGNPQVFFAGTFRGGVYKSADGGHTWKASNDGLDFPDIHALLVDPNDSAVVYCGTLGGGVFLSEDGGEHWRFIGLETSQVWDMAAGGQ